MEEFLGPDYLNCRDKIRPRIVDALIRLFGDEVQSERIAQYRFGMMTGGIGIGKTTIASIVLPYLAHWTLCLRDPQDFFDLLGGSRIAFMQMSTSGQQAKQVVFGDIKARIERAPWFMDNYRFDKNFKNQLRFPKEIWILPGDSSETTFEGYNILGGILDEADSHKVTDVKDYAEQGFNTINSRIESRFGKKGFLLVIGQMKRANGFAARKYEELRKDPTAFIDRMAIWESLGWDKFLRSDGERDSFWYNTKRHLIVPEAIVHTLNSEDIIEIPNEYRTSFENSPEKALRDLAGIPPLTGSPWISLAYKIEEAQDRWVARQNQMELATGFDPSRLSPVDEGGKIADWFVCTDPLKRVCAIDMAYSPDGDALGFAMGHVHEVVEIDGEWKPYIVFDLLMRIHAPAGREIFIADVRHMIYSLRDHHRFKIVECNTDGFESTDTRQQLNKRRIASEKISVDRQTIPYEDLREALYENRVEFPKYMVKYHEYDTEYTNIAYKELSELIDDGKKVDHPENGSKDVADAMASVVFRLMGDRTYHRRRSVWTDEDESSAQPIRPSEGAGLMGQGQEMKAPVPTFGFGPLWRPPK
jgi:hypothetical protein